MGLTSTTLVSSNESLPTEPEMSRDFALRLPQTHTVTHNGSSWLLLLAQLSLSLLQQTPARPLRGRRASAPHHRPASRIHAQAPFQTTTFHQTFSSNHSEMRKQKINPIGNRLGRFNFFQDFFVCAFYPIGSGFFGGLYSIPTPSMIRSSHHDRIS